MSVFSASDLPDIKLIKIINSTVTFALAETKTIKFTMPVGILAYIEMISIDSVTATLSLQATSMKVDNVEMLVIVTATSPSRIMYKPAEHAINTTTPTSPTAIPMRESLEFTLVSSILAGDVKFDIWAYVHEDIAKQFSKVASFTQL